MAKLILNRLLPIVVLRHRGIADVARATFQSGEHRGEPVVVLLRNVINLMVMAPGAVHGHGGSGGHHLRHHVIQI